MEFYLETSFSFDVTEFKLLITVMKMIIEVINNLNNFAKFIEANLNLLMLVHEAPIFIMLEISELLLILPKNTLCLMRYHSPLNTDPYPENIFVHTSFDSIDSKHPVYELMVYPISLPTVCYK
jgi:hypothetical protein